MTCMTNDFTAARIWSSISGICVVAVENFKENEFDCKCECGLNLIKGYHLMNLQVARNHLCRKFGKQIRIYVTSGTRCPIHNHNTPGSSKTSRHMIGDASDVWSPDLDTKELYYAIKELKLFSTMVYYKVSGVIHLDSRPGRYPAVCKTLNK